MTGRVALALGLVLASAGGRARADGTFCWNEVPAATAYHLYSAEVGFVPFYPWPGKPPAGLQAAAPAWSACDRETFSRDNCAAGTCCVYVIDRPGDLVFYFMTADDPGTPGRESFSRPVEACP